MADPPPSGRGWPIVERSRAELLAGPVEVRPLTLELMEEAVRMAEVFEQESDVLRAAASRATVGSRSRFGSRTEADWFAGIPFVVDERVPEGEIWAENRDGSFTRFRIG